MKLTLAKTTCMKVFPKSLYDYVILPSFVKGLINDINTGLDSLMKME